MSITKGLCRNPDVLGPERALGRGDPAPKTISNDMDAASTGIMTSSGAVATML